MTVNELFKLYAAYSEGKTIMCKTKEYHSGYYESHSWETTEEVDFGNLQLEELFDEDMYGSVHDSVQKTFFVKEDTNDKN